MVFFLIALAAVVLTAFFYRFLISPIVTEKYIREMLAVEGTDAPCAIPNILRAFVPKKNIFTSLSLPIPGKEGEEILYGTVVVTGAGIFIISRICGSGLIENPQSDVKWRFLSQGNVSEFLNPFKEQSAPRKLLSYYAESVGVKDVRVRTLVVYTDENLRFSEPITKGIIHISELYRRMKKLSSRGKLSWKSIRAISAVLAEAGEV